ncbi:N(G),N(G)-dimethylarginine dimethylaminohydrolase [Virgibacillus sp. NKC19-3]|uniref:dimethylarginine dimethylaminohydrolase family protein n=1 Tax=Virgibacillus saliphilus TaxID=2831674 RepID=UPI001C9B3E25|nr:arginine deiminase family protein [Virgibacillus sp. NKC19-3]MBY7144517.1 N(G),N(G)-dimethylarginine dimethylaminohydrolase [Virgibacillus sp. NKC19-3]
MFKNAIVKKPGESYINGLTTSDLGSPDYDLLLQQHEAYIKALEKCDVTITDLPANEEFPDSTFVEDTAVLTKEFAIICNPGASSRNRETEEMVPVLKNFYSLFHYIQAPGYVDGGDVLQIDNKFYIGLSDRTNRHGAEQFKAIVEQYQYEAVIVQLEEFFHLKTGIAYIGNDTVVVGGEFIDHPLFNGYKKIIVPKEEEYASNCIRVNDYVIMPEDFTTTISKVENAGFNVIEVPMSEFQKHDGGLSCLSLRF